jgi:hypothetical protein
MNVKSYRAEINRATLFISAHHEMEMENPSLKGEGGREWEEK